LFKSAEFLR
jgi:hypothetical protein